MREEFDIILVGAGAAGAAAAVGFAGAGLKTALVDRVDPDTAAGDDLRTTALLEPSIEFLERIDLWADLEPVSTPLSVLRIIDRGEAGRLGAAPRARDFEASALGAEAFGRNIANSALKQALASRMAALGALERIAPAQILSTARRNDAALMTVETASGLRRLVAPLIVAADGKNSRIRVEAGVPTRRIDPGQRASICVFRHPEPHRNVSIEIYSEGGPFTLVPFLDDADGSPRSSLVWMKRNREAARLEALSDADFAAAATAMSEHAFGPLELASVRKSWKVETLLAERFAARRLALMGEAAHATPPIGAQGLNMSLADAAALLTEALGAKAAGRDLGDAALLSAYERARRSDVGMRVGAVTALGVAANGVVRPLRAARRGGLAAVHGLRPLRQAVMRRGLGASDRSSGR